MLIEKLDGVMQQSHLVRWDQPFINAAPIRLMVDLDRIHRRWPNIWELSWAEIVATCAGHADTLQMLENTDPVKLAHAIRLQRLSNKQNNQ